MIWLLVNGANLGVTNHDGVVLYDNAMSKEGSDVVIEHMQFVCRQRREEAIKKGALRSCKFCKKETLKKCRGCFLVWYCGKECQMAGWENHRQECKEIKDEYVTCELRKIRYKSHISIDDTMKNMRITYPKIYCKPKESTHFIVKIQAPWKPLRDRDEKIPVRAFHQGSDQLEAQDLKKLTESLNIGNKEDLTSVVYNINKGQSKLELKPIDHDMVVYNEERTIFGVITPSMDMNKELLDTIRKEGVLGVVAYFYSYWEDGVGLKINLKRVQPPESWCTLVDSGVTRVV